MRILQIVTAFYPSTIYGGPASVALDQTEALVERGHDVTLLTTNLLSLKPKKTLEANYSWSGKVRVIYFPTRNLGPKFSLVTSSPLVKWLTNNIQSFDLVHIHFGREWIPVRCAQLSISRGIPTFIQTHGMLDRVEGVRTLIDRVLTRKLLSRASGVLSLQTKEDQTLKRISPNAKTLRLVNGLTEVNIATYWTEDNLSTPIVLFVARLHPRKRVLAFIQMAKLLTDRKVDARFRIVGPDGGDLEEATQLVAKNNLAERVTFVGSLTGQTLFQEYANAAVYVLPSINEPFGLTIFEALQVGVPTVVTDTAAVKQMLVEYQAAVISSPEPEALAEAVFSILANTEKARALSSSGRKLVAEHLHLSKVIDQLEGYYKEVVNDVKSY